MKGKGYALWADVEDVVDPDLGIVGDAGNDRSVAGGEGVDAWEGVGGVAVAGDGGDWGCWLRWVSS